MTMMKKIESVPVTNQGGSYYARIPLYVRKKVEMVWNIADIAGCELTWYEDEDGKAVAYIAPKPPDVAHPIEDGEPAKE